MKPDLQKLFLHRSDGVSQPSAASRIHHSDIDTLGVYLRQPLSEGQQSASRRPHCVRISRLVCAWLQHVCVIVPSVWLHLPAVCSPTPL